MSDTIYHKGFNLNSFAGVNYIVTEHAVERYRDYSRFNLLSFHKSKLKRYRPKIIEKPAAYEFEGKMFVHPVLMQRLRDRLATEIERDLDQMAINAMRGIS